MHSQRVILLLNVRSANVALGGFLPFVTPDNIYDISCPRNPDFFDALYFMGYVKCAHEGTRRMRETMQNLQLPPPIFCQSGTSHIHFKVILKNNVEQRKVWIDADAKQVVGEMIFQTLNESEKRIINYVADFKRINVSDAVRITTKEWGACKKILDGLAKRKILRHVHTGKLRNSTAHYVLWGQ
jgi:ATP-dependent DNA helicase RecG